MVRRDVKYDEGKAMRCSLERELQLHVVEEILAPKEEPQIDVEQPHAKDPGVETPTQAKSSKDERKSARKYDRSLQDVRENMGAPTSHHK